MLLEHGLVVEGVHMARAAVHEAKDDILCPRREMRCGGTSLAGKQSIQRQHAESSGGLLEKAATGEDRSHGAGTSGVFHKPSDSG